MFEMILLNPQFRSNAPKQCQFKLDFITSFGNQRKTKNFFISVSIIIFRRTFYNLASK